MTTISPPTERSPDLSGVLARCYGYARDATAGRIVVGEKVAPKPKRKEIERIPVDHSRLLDAITEPYQDKQRRRAISYTTEIEKG